MWESALGQHHLPGERVAKPLLDRLDHWLRELNAFLLAVALGLAILDVTCFTALKLRDMPVAYGNDAAPALSQTQLTSALVR